MKYQVQVEYVEDEKMQNRRYQAVLEFLINLCHDEEEADEKSSNLSSSIH